MVFRTGMHEDRQDNGCNMANQKPHDSSLWPLLWPSTGYLIFPHYSLLTLTLNFLSSWELTTPFQICVCARVCGMFVCVYDVCVGICGGQKVILWSRFFPSIFFFKTVMRAYNVFWSTSQSLLSNSSLSVLPTFVWSFINTPSSLTATWIHMDIGQSTGAWVTSQDPQPWKKKGLYFFQHLPWALELKRNPAMPSLTTLLIPQDKTWHRSPWSLFSIFLTSFFTLFLPVLHLH